MKVKTMGTCGMDVAIRNNSFLGRHGKVQFPLIPGHEFYGEVQELGLKVRKLTKGDRVATSAIKGCGKRRACKKGIYNRCQNRDHVGIDAQGSFAEYVCIAEDILFPVTAAIEMTTPGNLFLMGGSGYRGESVSFKPWNVFRDEKQIKGLHGFSMDDYLTVLDLYKGGEIRIRPLISRIMPLEEINEACDSMEQKKVLKIILTP